MAHPPKQLGALGLCGVGASLGLVWVTAFLGPSSASPELPGAGALPPYTLDTSPGPVLVTSLLAVATLLGAAGVWLAWRAVRAGWEVRPARLVAAGVLAILAFTLVPPVTDDDVVSYAAYGRIAVLGHNPYRTAPSAVPDPVTDAVGPTWRDTPSIYGPLATGEQQAVMRVAGKSLRTGVALLSALGALALVVTVLVLDAVAGTDERRRRAAVLVGLNPLVLIPVVAGAHLDALLALCVVGAVAAGRRRPLLAGMLAGAAFDVKLTGALAVAGLAWWLRAERRRLAAFAVGVVLAVVPAYLLAGGTSAFGQVRRAARFVSLASPWRPLIAARVPRGLVLTGAALLFVAMVLALRRRLPGEDQPGWATAVLFLSWLLSAAYLLPWYDVVAWSGLALLAWSWLDVVLLVHTTVLVLAYLPGRELALHGGLYWALKVTRVGIAPAVLIALLVVSGWSRATARHASSRSS